MQLRIQNSEKKKLVEEESHFREIEMKFLDKESSRQYSQVMEEIMKNNLRKESHPSFHKSKSKSRTSLRDPHQVYQPNYKTAMPSRQQKQPEKEISDKVSAKSEESQQPVEHLKRIPYKFSFKSLLIELLVAYSVTFALLYFIRLAQFPYFQLILIVALTVAVHPWKSSNLLMLIAIGIVFGNHFLGLSVFTYPSIVICYYSVLVFNERHKQKQLFVIVLVFTLTFSFVALKAIAVALVNQGRVSTYAFLFPLFMFILRIVLNYCYWVIGKTAVIFLQLPLFLTGLEYGAILSYDLNTIQFWYLLVAFSLQIINDRTQFLLGFLLSIKEYCTDKNEKEKDEKEEKKERWRILPAHANGYACLHSFHLFILVYIYAGLELYTPPYAWYDPIKVYMTPGYKPIVIWLLSSIYEILSVLLEKGKKNVLLFGFTSNKWWRSVLRGFVLSLGMWAFYLGLALGARTFLHTPTI